MQADDRRAAQVEHAEMSRLGPWFHNLHLPDGAQTAPGHPFGDFPTVKWRQIAPYIADDLSDCRALDVGCNGGFYSFELARRGADVTAIDIDEHYLRQARWAARQYGLAARIDFRRASVYSLHRSQESYDLVLFLGVLYHLRHPMLALDILRGISVGRLVLQTMTAPGKAVVKPPASLALDARKRLNARGWPRMAFVERAIEDDPTNWWAPTHACVEAMARAAGFRVLARPGHEIYVCEPNHAEQRFGAESRSAEMRAIFDTD
jgi:tRNA (mo5U34)-methyltransferase